MIVDINQNMSSMCKKFEIYFCRGISLSLAENMRFKVIIV